MRDVARRAEKRGRGEGGESNRVSLQDPGPSDKTEEVGLASPCCTWQWEPGLESPTPSLPLLSDLVALACPVLCREGDERTA